MVKVIRERDIEKYLVQQAKKRGCEVRKVQWVGRRGAPDRVVFGTQDGIANEEGVVVVTSINRATWVELKAPGEKPTTIQKREHARLRAFGERVRVVDSFEAVDALF